MTPDICAYISHLNKDLILKDASIRRKIITLKNFYDYLINYEIIITSPFDKLKFKFKQERKLPKTLPISDIHKILKCFDIETDSLSNFALKEYIRDAALLDLLISTGIRIDDAVAITLDDITASETTLLIHGKGRKQRLIYISSPITWNRIKALMKERCQSTNNYLFVNRYDLPITIYGVEDIYKKYVKKAQIKKKSTPHYLRHTFATNLLANSADLLPFKKYLVTRA